MTLALALVRALLYVLMFEIVLICAILNKQNELWKPEEPKADKDGFVPVNRQLVEAIAQGKL